MARLPLEDIRVVDFGWVLAGSHSTRLLADLGAQVFKVESKAKLDGWRIVPPLRQGVSSPLEEGSGGFQEQNRNKKGLILDIKEPKGRDILERLVATSDIVTANFSSSGFKKLGLEWEKLREFNPGIIVVSMPGMGNWGPYSDFMTFGPNLHAISGVLGLTGYPDQEPVGVGIPWADYIAGATLAMSVLAALEYRKRTGEGQFIDISQDEIMVSCNGSSLLDWAANGKMRDNVGNRHPSGGAAPHGCYRCKGDERWCVISAASEEEWENFCNVLGNPGWTQDPRFATLPDRVKHQEELDTHVQAWTMTQSPEEVMEKLQRGNVSAGVVQNIEDILKRDNHLRERGFLVELEFPPSDRKPASVVLPGVITRFTGVSIPAPNPAPSHLGEDNDYILKEILHMTQEEIDQTAAEGVFK